MSRRVALVLTDISQENAASVVRVTRIVELGPQLPLRILRIFSQSASVASYC
jgi:hypothetical protein